MIIQVNPDWRLESDPLQWIIQKRRTVKGRERWSNVSYHNTLDNAVIRLAQTRVRIIGGHYPPEAMATLCHTLDNLSAEIRAVLSSVPWNRASNLNNGRSINDQV